MDIPDDRLRVADWASLNASLVWAYTGTYPAAGSDLHTEPLQIAAWLILQGRVKVITAAGNLSAGADTWLLPGRSSRRQIFSGDARVLSVNFRAIWPDGRWLFPGERPAAFPAASDPRLARESIKLARYVAGHFGAEGVTLRLLSLRLADFLNLERQFFGWLELLVRAAEFAGLEIAIPTQVNTRVTEAVRVLNRWPMEEPFRERLLARRAGLSVVHLNRLFLGSLGVTARAYFERHRMERALELLRVSDLSVKEIAAKLGFSSSAYFSAWFQRLRRCSPTTYRKDNRI